MVALRSYSHLNLVVIAAVRSVTEPTTVTTLARFGLIPSFSSPFSRLRHLYLDSAFATVRE